MTKIFITGGHFTPALAVIQELSKSNNWKIFYIGRKQAMEGDRALSLEYQELSTLKNIHFLRITPGRVQPKFFVNPFQSLAALAKIPFGFFQSFLWVLKYRPGIILSFGGYIAVPVVISAWLIGIPIVTHEQTVTTGLANRLIAAFSKKILVSWPDSLRDYPRHKVVLVGNPLRTEILSQIGPEVQKINSPKNILVTGGNQGSHVINLAVSGTLTQILAEFNLIHQTGDSSVFRDFDILSQKKNQLTPSLQKKYTLQKFLNTAEMAEALKKSDLVISRSGANTITELAALGKVAILIPIPFSKNQEQFKNARILQQAGSGVIIEQDKLTPASLWKLICDLRENFKNYQQNAQNFRGKIPLDTTSKIVIELSKVLR